MSGNSNIGTSLVDDLLEVIDELRSDLNTDMGSRAYRLYAVKRRWSGGFVGDGDYFDNEVELAPQPLVHPFKSSSDLSYNQEPCGLDEAGFIKVTEVSLRWSFEDLLACEAEEGTQHLLKITEAHGQKQPARYFSHEKPPYPDRVDTIGWVLSLVHLETEPCL